MSIAKQLRTLAKGINPDTGEQLDKASVANSPEGIRLLFSLAEELSYHSYSESKKSSNKPKSTTKEQQEKNIKQGKPKNSHLRWSDEDKKSLVAEFRNNDDLRDIAQKFERSVLAIAVQLGNAGLLTEAEVDYYRVETSINN